MYRACSCVGSYNLLSYSLKNLHMLFKYKIFFFHTLVCVDSDTNICSGYLYMYLRVHLWINVVKSFFMSSLQIRLRIESASISTCTSTNDCKAPRYSYRPWFQSSQQATGLKINMFLYVSSVPVQIEAQTTLKTCYRYLTFKVYMPNLPPLVLF